MTSQNKRIAFDGAAVPTGLFGSDDGRAGFGKWIEDDGAAAGHIANGVGNKRRRRPGRRAGRTLGRAGPEAGDAGIVPDVGAAGLTELDGGGVRHGAILEREHERVAARVEATADGVRPSPRR